MKHFIFDFGAVVFRWRPPVLLSRLVPEHTPTPEAAQALAHRFFVEGGDWSRFDRGTIEVPELVARIAARTGLAPAQVQAVIDAVPAELAPLPDTVAWLAHLREAGHRLFYLSNMPRPYARHLSQAHPFLSWFEAGLYSADVGHIKPERAVFELALQRFGVAAHDCVFLDDHPDNVRAARALGLQAVQFVDALQAQRDVRLLDAQHP